MCVEEFSELKYEDQLQLIDRSGRLKQSFIKEDYQFTLYRIRDFYVELKRSIHDFSFEKITALRSNELPDQYNK